MIRQGRLPVSVIFLFILMSGLEAPCHSDDLSLSLRAEGEECYVYEDIYLLVSIKNESDTVRFIPVFSAECAIHIEITDTKSGNTRWLHAGWDCHESDQEIPLEPHREFSDVIPLSTYYGVDDPRHGIRYFPKGRYLIRAKADLEPGDASLSILSSPIQIEIVDPPRREKGVLKKYLEGRKFFNSERERVIDFYRDLLDKHPESRYAPTIFEDLAFRFKFSEERPETEQEICPAFIRGHPERFYSCHLLNNLKLMAAEADFKALFNELETRFPDAVVTKFGHDLDYHWDSMREAR